MKSVASTACLIGALFVAGCASRSPALSPQRETPRTADSHLHDEIASLDRIMFDAFNRHDIVDLMAFFGEDLEFFHDTGGRLGYTQVRDGFQSNFVKNDGLRRDLVPGSLEVYPIQGYGAIEVGAHRFCHEEEAQTQCGTFRFVHVWEKKEGAWKVTRVISYDH